METLFTGSTTTDHPFHAAVARATVGSKEEGLPARRAGTPSDVAKAVGQALAAPSAE
mgnify:CR=1 FL=1